MGDADRGAGRLGDRGGDRPQLRRFAAAESRALARSRCRIRRRSARRFAATLEGLLAGAAIGFGSGDLVRAARLRRGRELGADYASTWAERGAEVFALALLVFVTALVTRLGTLALVISGLAAVALRRAARLRASAGPPARRLAAQPARAVVGAAGVVAREGCRHRRAVVAGVGERSGDAGPVPARLSSRAEPANRGAHPVGINAAIAIPAAPGNFGTFEAGAALALCAAGAPRDLALSYALTYHLTHVVPVAVVATVVYLVRSYRTTPAGASTAR